MTATALLLIAASVVLHVGWNALSRVARPHAAFFFVSMMTSALVLSPVLVWQRGEIAATVGLLWPALLLTGLFSTIYNVALARAYRDGELSLVYPLARATGPVAIAIVSLALGRAEAIGAGCLAGIGMILIGSALLPLHSAADLRAAPYGSLAFRFALLSALATAGYTLVDDHALRVLREARADVQGELARSLLYAALHAATSAFGLGAWVLARADERRALARLRPSLGRAVLVGIGGYASYVLILTAMGFVSDVTYVAAFRQLGVPLAVLVGGLALREPLSGARLAGAALCTLGLLGVALG